MDKYPYPLYFEARELTAKERKKITKKFNKIWRRDCCCIEKVGDKSYKICFKKQEDREKVLLKKFHTISLPSRDLHLHVSQTLKKGIQKIFKLDVFLLYYLIDNRELNRILQNGLSCIGCTVDFNPDEEQAVIRGTIEKESEDACRSSAENWEKLVDSVFSRFITKYQCYHIFEPKQVKFLLQDLSVVTDDIRMYTADGHVVLVGEMEAIIQNQILLLEKCHTITKEVPFEEKQYKLVEKEFIQQLGIHGPEVKINIGDAKIILEGPEEEVQSGVAKLEELIKKVLGSDSHSQDHQVQATQGSLISDSLILDGPGAQWYFWRDGQVSKNLVERSCQVLIREEPHKCSHIFKPKLTSTNSSSVCKSFIGNTVGSTVVNKASLEIKLGSLEVEQVNVLVVPMLKNQLTSTQIGRCLLKKAGNELKAKFEAMAVSCTLAPGDILQVDAPSSLGCTKLFFIECSPWDGVRGQSMQALGKGLKACLQLCIQQRLGSVAFPIIGPGILKYPLTKAIQVLVETMRQFGLSTNPGSLSTIHIVIKPGYTTSDECYHEVYRQLNLNVNHGGQEIFRTLKSDLDNISMTVGSGVKLQLVFGDITNETTDAVVNTTDFVHFQNDVCRDILTLAGPVVADELKSAIVKKGDVFITSAGSCPCIFILHVCGEKDACVVEELVIRIIDTCEKLRIKSVAIPAICAGAGGLDPGVVASAILRGIKTATSSSLCSLTDIHLVLIKINVFLAFKEEALEIFYTPFNKATVPQFPNVQQSYLSLSADLTSLSTTIQDQKSTFLISGVSRKDVDEAMTMLKSLYQAQCSIHTFKEKELAGMTPEDMEDVKHIMVTQGLIMKKNESDSLTVSGLKDGIKQVTQMITASLQGSLKNELRLREEEDLYSRVAWCILEQSGNWERLPKRASYNLENNEMSERIVDAQGIVWSVDLHRMEATLQATAQTTMLKRLVNRPDFTLPLYWDNMDDGEDLKLFMLAPSSPEYRRVEEAFKRTAVSKSVIKIERVQNVHLRRAYEVQKKHLSEKNKQEGGVCEKLLYHGTTNNNCNSIMKTGFNRSFAGKNGITYGHGTYFAVHARLSANSVYSKPAAYGSQEMFVARVLTGIYTEGHSYMKVPPLRNDTDHYDSLVNVLDDPDIFVVFHDNQAYPDYLITFK